METKNDLGKCAICGLPAVVEYLLLPGSPKFCNKHYKPEYAEKYGVDFSGPDDFDIPFGDFDD